MYKRKLSCVTSEGSFDRIPAWIHCAKQLNGKFRGMKVNGNISNYWHIWIIVVFMNRVTLIPSNSIPKPTYLYYILTNLLTNVHLRIYFYLPPSTYLSITWCHPPTPPTVLLLYLPTYLPTYLSTYLPTNQHLYRLPNIRGCVCRFITVVLLATCATRSPDSWESRGRN